MVHVAHVVNVYVNVRICLTECCVWVEDTQQTVAGEVSGPSGMAGLVGWQGYEIACSSLSNRRRCVVCGYVINITLSFPVSFGTNIKKGSGGGGVELAHSISVSHYINMMLMWCVRCQVGVSEQKSTARSAQ